MATLADFDTTNVQTIGSKSVNSNNGKKELLSEGKYDATILSYRNIASDKGKGFKLVLGVNKPFIGLVFIEDTIGLGYEPSARKWAIGKCTSLCSALGIPKEVFDLDNMVEEKNRHYLLGKKVSILVGQKEGQWGGRFNNVEGYFVCEHPIKSDLSPKEQPTQDHVSLSVNKVSSDKSSNIIDDVPSYVSEEDSFSNIEIY